MPQTSAFVRLVNICRYPAADPMSVWEKRTAVPPGREAAPEGEVSFLLTLLPLPATHNTAPIKKNMLVRDKDNAGVYRDAETEQNTRLHT